MRRRFMTMGRKRDTLAPTCTITCTQVSPTSTSPLNMTFTFSESVTGFVVGDITVGNGSAGNFSGSGTTYTADVTPTALGTVTVDVGAGVCTDAAGNANTAATQFSIVYNTLTVNQQAAWHLDEASDGSGAVTRNDATGNANHLTDLNTTPSGTGLLSSGADLERDNSEVLQRASTASLLVGDIDFTIAVWVKLETKDITNYLASKGSSTAAAANMAWRMFVTAGANQVQFDVSNGSAITSITSNEALNTGTWYLVIAWHDSVNNQLGIKISANASKTASYSNGCLDDANFPFKLGGAPSAVGFAGSNPLDGMLDEVGFWKKVLTAAEITALYNGGLGRAYPFFSDVALIPVIASSESMPSAAYPIPITITFPRNVTGLTASDFTASGVAISNLAGSGASYTALIAPISTSGTIQLPAGRCTGASDGSQNLVSNTLSISSSLTLPTSYMQGVLALSPTSYWTMQENTGTNLVDVSGNDRPGTNSASATTGVAGKYGTCYLFPGGSNKQLTSSARLTAAVDMREYSCAMWVKVNVNASAQVRLYNASNGAEYSVVEIRNGDNMTMFTRENGSDQDVALGVTAQDEVWVHIVQFNSQSTGKAGMYYNGTLYEFTKTLGGLSNPVPGANNPNVFLELEGWAQHVAVFDHKLSQSEVNTICT